MEFEKSQILVCVQGKCSNQEMGVGCSEQVAGKFLIASVHQQMSVTLHGQTRVQGKDECILRVLQSTSLIKLWGQTERRTSTTGCTKSGVKINGIAQDLFGFIADMS